MNAQRKSPRSAARPTLEVLEDRTAPAVIVVTTTADAGAGSLREAITTAVGTGEGDQIVFASAIQGQTITLATALPDINGGGALSIIGPGGTPSGITLDGNGAVRPLNITAGAGAVVLTNLTLTSANSGAGNNGGAVQNAGTATLSNVIVTQSRAGGSGGGIFNSGTLTLNDTSISNNFAVSGAASDGGGIANTGTLTLNRSRVVGNQAGGAGGGISNNGAAAVASVNESTVAGNIAGSTGGGLVNSLGATATIRRSTLSGNQTDGAGGGVGHFGAGSVLNVLNSTIANNLSDGDFGGGGVLIISSTAVIVNSTIVGNADTANFGGGGGGISKFAGSLTLANSIVSANRAGPGTVAENVAAGVIDTNNDNFIDGDPALGPLQDNGGPTFTLAPQDGSPVIDAGSNAFATETGVAGGTPLTGDQRGFPRILGGTVDQGAVERFSPSTTTSLAVTQDGAEVTGTSTARRVNLTATVTASTSGITPQGSVLFFRDPTPADPTDAPVPLNTTPIPLSTAGTATLPNVSLPAGPNVLFARFVPSSQAFRPSASPERTVTARVTDTVGVFDPNAVFALLNQNTTTTTGPDFSYSFGIGGDLPVVGNWTGSASRVDLPGVVRNVGGLLQWTLADENPPVLPNLPDFLFGAAGQVPLTGDWDGDGTTGVGVYDPLTGVFALRNAPNAGPADLTFTFGGQAFVPVVGNWDGAGGDEVGVYNPATGQWLLLANNADGAPLFTPAFPFGGLAGARPVTGDWDGDGADGIGIFFPQPSGFGGFLLKNTPGPGAPDVNGGNVILAGLATWLPLAGNWGPAPNTTNELLALTAGGGQGSGGAPLDALQLAPALDGALARLASAGADPAVLNTLANTRLVLADLPGATLGLADPAGGSVFLDLDAAGHGWFLDETPWEDSEFASGPVQGIDLLTALLHEMGHLLGAGHDEGGLMGESLSAGVRHTDALDSLFAAVPLLR